MRSDTYKFFCFEDVVRHYRDNFAGEARRRMRWFGDPSQTLEGAISRACRSEMPTATGRLERHPHQKAFRFSDKLLATLTKRLQGLQCEIAEAADFTSLYDLILCQVGAIKGVGPLLVYDVAARIARYRGLTPLEIYLHCGSKKGATALGVPTNSFRIPLASLPIGLQALSADEAEDILCVYRDDLARLHHCLSCGQNRISCYGKIQKQSLGKRISTENSQGRRRACL